MSGFKVSQARKIKMEKKTPKEIYEKPVFEEQKGLIFPGEIMEMFNNGRFCVLCSSCHGCR